VKACLLAANQPSEDCHFHTNVLSNIFVGPVLSSYFPLKKNLGSGMRPIFLCAKLGTFRSRVDCRRWRERRGKAMVNREDPIWTIIILHQDSVVSEGHEVGQQDLASSMVPYYRFHYSIKGTSTFIGVSSKIPPLLASNSNWNTSIVFHSAVPNLCSQEFCIITKPIQDLLHTFMVNHFVSDTSFGTSNSFPICNSGGVKDWKSICAATGSLYSRTTAQSWILSLPTSSLLLKWLADVAARFQPDSRISQSQGLKQEPRKLLIYLPEVIINQTLIRSSRCQEGMLQLWIRFG